MIDVFKGFIAFLQGTPLVGQKISPTLGSKSMFTLRALLVLLAIKLGIGLIATLLVKAHIIADISKHDALQNWLAHSSTVEFLVEVVLIGPVLEELAFRGILQPNVELVWISFSCLLYMLVSNGLRIDYYSINPTTLALMGFSVLSSWLLRPTSSRFVQWTSSVDRHQSLIWVSALGFALLHYSNYPLKGVGPQTVLVVLFPHVVAGLLLSWTAQRNGLPWSICLHALNNVLAALFVLKDKSWL